MSSNPDFLTNPDLSQRARLLAAILSRTPPRLRFCTQSNSDLAGALHISLRTLQRALAELQAAGFVCVERDHTLPSRRSIELLWRPLRNSDDACD